MLLNSFKAERGEVRSRRLCVCVCVVVGGGGGGGVVRGA